jgi:hypothetical protein
LVSQSPYRVGSGPFGPWNSLGIGFASAAAACRRASASASARWAADESGFRSGTDAVVSRCEGLSVIALSSRGLAYQIQHSHRQFTPEL